MQIHNRQRGGTILGMIIGLIIGLGIALAVAVMITKTPMPFTNKLGRPEKAPDPAAGQIPDPNKPLYGNKTAAKEAAKAFAKKDESAESPAPVPVDKKGDEVAAMKPENKAPVVEQSVTEKPKKAEKPEKAEANAPDAKEANKDTAVKSDGADEKGIYYLQAGAFREQTDAEKIRAKLALIGVEARISERQSENGVLYRVRVGPFSQTDAMNRVRTKLSDNGVDAAVVRIAKQ